MLSGARSEPAAIEMRMLCVSTATRRRVRQCFVPAPVIRIEFLYMVRSGCIKELDGADTAHDSIANFCLPGELLTLQSAGPAYSRTTCLAVQARSFAPLPWRIVEEACAAARMSPAN